MYRAGLAAILVVSVVGGAAHAGETAADWRKKPTAEQLFAVWPTEALKKGISGKAEIRCLISVQGALFDCKVESEQPEGMGFGAAAIALTPQFLMKPATRDGKPVVSGVQIPINFSGPSRTTGSHLPGGTPLMTRRVVSNLVWDQAPTYADVAAAYPEKARVAGVAGRVTLRCALKADGRLTTCSTLTEEPPRMGFSAAAKALLPRFQGPTQFSDGQSISGTLTQVPFVFAPDMLDPGERVVGKASWAVLPSGDAMSAGYPRKALDAGVEQARVTMSCVAGAGGNLEGCAVSKEDPAGLGFAEAALALSESFRIRPWTDDGLPTIGGTITVPIRYQAPKEPAVAAPNAGAAP